MAFTYNSTGNYNQFNRQHQNNSSIHSVSPRITASGVAPNNNNSIAKSNNNNNVAMYSSPSMYQQQLAMNGSNPIPSNNRMSPVWANQQNERM